MRRTANGVAMSVLVAMLALVVGVATAGSPGYSGSRAVILMAQASPATVVSVAGTRIFGFPTGTMNDKLNGVLADGNDVSALPYPASMSWSSQSKGIKAMTVRMSEVGEFTVVYGYSQGAEVITGWLSKTAKDPSLRPDEDKLRLVLIAWPIVNAMRPGTTVPDNPYETIIVGKMYDGFTDMPTRFSITAYANAIAGMLRKEGHLDYNDLDFDDPRNMILVNGKQTKVLFYTEHLPKNMFWRNIGLDAFADKLDARDRVYIERAYDRSGYVLAEPGQIREILEGVTRPAEQDERLSGMSSDPFARQVRQSSLPQIADDDDQLPPAKDPEQEPDQDAVRNEEAGNGIDEGLNGADSGDEGAIDAEHEDLDDEEVASVLDDDEREGSPTSVNDQEHGPDGNDAGQDKTNDTTPSNASENEKPSASDSRTED